ncbi:ABC transporter substrate-binding protein [Streptomyces umbrinus]|uniref:ABC transporter substrate-binding protein n=1 Tax=Streptomyces umbrinus TaxID=67370 RepID=UPI003427B78E
MDTTSRAAAAAPPARRRRGRRTTALTGVVCASALLATACAGGDTGTKGSPDSSKPKLTSQLPAAAAKDVDHLTIALPTGEPGSIDPLQAFDYSPNLVISNLCDPLLRVTPDFKLKPNVATSWKWTDRKTFVLQIRKGIKFWDGKALTAEDVAYSLKRSIGPGALTGGLLQTAKSVKATGPDQVTVNFSTYDEQFVKQLAAPGYGVLQKVWAEKAGKDLGTAKGGLMCSGPFKLDAWNTGSSIELERNDAYWNPDFRAHAKRITLKSLTDSTALAQALVSGEVDGAWEVPPAVTSRLSSTSGGSLHYGPSFQYLELAAARPDGPLADKKLRRALFKAIDREALAKVVFKGAGAANYTSLTPSSWEAGAEDIYREAYKKYVKLNAYDIEAAKKLVASSKSTSQTLKLVTMAGDETQSQIAQLIQQQAKEIGLKVAIEALQPLQYSDIFVNPSARKDVDLMIAVGYNQTSDPQELLGFLAMPGSPYNFTNFDDKQATDAWIKARGTEDVRARAQEVLKVQDRFESSYAGTSLVAPYEVSYFSDKVAGATTSFVYMFTPSLALLGSPS